MERKAYPSGSIIQFSRMKESSWIYFFIHPSSELAQLYFVTGIQIMNIRETNAFLFNILTFFEHPGILGGVCRD